MTIELYAFPPSPRAFKAIAVAEHLGIDWRLCMVDLTKGDHRQPDYAALNPNMRMPTLKDGDYVLWESNAIMQYLAGRKPGAGLLPQDERGRLDVSRWQFWDATHWDPACATFIFEHVVKALMNLGAPDAAAIAKGNELFNRAAGVLDAHLAKNRFVTGANLSIADFGLGAPLNYAEPAHIPLDAYPHVQRWFAELSALPAWQKALAMATPRAAQAA